MKANTFNSTEDSAKVPLNKSNKKSTKSRSKSSKSEATGASGSVKSANCMNNYQTSITAGSIATTPTTPTTSNPGNLFDTSLNTITNGGGIGTDANNSSKSHAKSYAGLEGRSVKIIWEQHDQSDLELSPEVCARVAEDVSYKLWELVNNIKTYARHSGGNVTYDLVNEVLADADVPPALGAMDSEWDRIDYDGSYFFYSDRIVELRDEYQKEVKMEISDGPDYECTWPIDEKQNELSKKFVISLMKVVLHGNEEDIDTALSEAAFSPLLGACYRVILSKLIQILAFKQNDDISLRCWRLLRSCSCNTHARLQNVRVEYFHLSEILISQLLAPYESIKVHSDSKPEEQRNVCIKTEVEEEKADEKIEVKTEFVDQSDIFNSQNTSEEKVYKLQNDVDNEGDVEMRAEISPYFASPVNWNHVDELCDIIGHLATSNGFFQKECIFHIIRRLQRFFDGRCVSTERDFKYLSRALRGLVALGEYAFREFIPFIYKFNVDDVPESFWNDFSISAVFVNGPDDIFLYEWLEFLCGADKLQPFLVYYAQYFEKFLTMRFLRRKVGSFKIYSKPGVRRLEWNTLAAAMCHGDDPNKALKPKPKIEEVFPDLVSPNLQLNRAGNIRFKFAGCRPVIIKSKGATNTTKTSSETNTSNILSGHNDILIARRKLFKPLTNERRIVPLSSYYYVRI
ncbi:uncharacterized protein LOC101461947 [Ceratitis capitata]|uniref:(Mediterranean fruit fly) hypothetical protein n=1 Tax=Ceratitis capitata TaxID=7213 RepID=A0A811UKS9_CERCA|nr:uncharacterized protein LOC101461947 [Ceratitis capitata]CAD6998938.1 unnamed protein product [Ceratitis capitata]